MSVKLTTINVMPLNRQFENELAADALQLQRDEVCGLVGCMMTLVPESNPPVDKARILGGLFASFRRAFRGDHATLGILAQATIGHGWQPDEAAPFQKIVRPDGSEAYQMCPLDHNFQDYIRNTFSHLAALRPAFFMVDDDFRLLAGRNGCYCPLHLKAIGERLGRTFTRDELLETLRRDAKAAKAYDQLLLDSLMELATIIRQSIDTVDSTIPVSFCACFGDIRHAEPLARRLAAPGQPLMIRINNGRYLHAEMRTFPVRMANGAAQVAGFAPEVTTLAETDPCPHNRYSTGARLMHSHYVGSLLEGCRGGKHWLTRLSTAYQPQSGKAYREILAQHSRLYQEVADAVAATAPAAYAAAAFPSKPYFNPAPDLGSCGASPRTWANVIGSMGIPCNYAHMPNLPVMLTGDDVVTFSDDDLCKLLAGGALLDGSAAEAISKRGLAALIGVQATPWDGSSVSEELWGDVRLPRDLRYSRLTPLADTVAIHSSLLHRRSGVSEEVTEIGPAATLFHNANGGRIAALAASTGTGNSLSAVGCGFYDEDRKRQLVDLLTFVCAEPIPFYYPGDAEVYLKLRRYPDGRHLLALFNLGHDPLATIPLTSAKPLALAENLAADGTWHKVEYVNNELQIDLPPAYPRIVRISGQH